MVRCEMDMRNANWKNRVPEADAGGGTSVWFKMASVKEILTGARR